ncbi:unnamed protein product [Linum trigynum]|uniref:Uncharacterized protein n=1 Tax=Linum trigynum TaxID=586398 RepID=A0AAV2CYV4_9ROSI
MTRRGRRTHRKGVHATEARPSLEAKTDGLIKVLLKDRSQGKRLVMVCEWCASPNHTLEEFQVTMEANTLEEQVNFIVNARGNNNKSPYSNTTNPGWHNHANFSWASPATLRSPCFEGPSGGYQPRLPFSQPRYQFQETYFHLQQYQPQSGKGYQQPDKISKLEDFVTQAIKTALLLWWR